MSKYSFGVDVPSLLVLAWLASRSEHRNAVVQPECASEPWRQRQNGAEMIETILEQELATQADQAHRYAPVFLQLVRHQFARVDFDSVEWALRGENAVYFKEDAIPGIVDKERKAFATQPATQVARDALASHEPLRGYVQSVLGRGVSKIEQSGSILQHLFLREADTMFSPLPGAFLLRELLYHSLQHIEWEQLASWLLNLAA